MTLDFWFEFASTYSYPAAMRIAPLAKARGFNVRWRPFLLGPIFKSQEWDDSPFNLYPAKGRYMWRDLERICGALGLPLVQPSPFPQNGLLAARVALIALQQGWGEITAVRSTAPSSMRDAISPNRQPSPACWPRSARMPDRSCSRRRATQPRQAA